jgi:hypothetical protein
MSSEKQQEHILPISEKDLKTTKDGFESTECPLTKTQIRYLLVDSLVSFVTLAIVTVEVVFFNIGYVPSFVLVTMALVGMIMLFYCVMHPILEAGYITKGCIRTLESLLIADLVGMILVWMIYGFMPLLANSCSLCYCKCALGTFNFVIDQSLLVLSMFRFLTDFNCQV